jgi:homoprotocatechuate degradation regulator HpaR
MSVGAARNRVRPSGYLRDIELSLPLQLLKAREAAMVRFRPMLRGHGLTEQQWRVIRVLAAGDALDGRALARRSMLLAPSLTRILQYFESQDTVKRSAHASDQRRALFTLTSKGRRLFDTVAPDAEALYDAIASEFGGAKLASLYRLLAEFSAALGADAGE